MGLPHQPIQQSPLKGTHKWKRKLASKKHQKYATISICRLHMAVLSMFMQYEFCFASYLSISGCCTQHPVVHSLLVVHSLPVKNRKGLGYDIMYTSAACVSLSITQLKQTVLKTQNSSIHGCVLATFKHWFITNQSLNGLKNCYGICVLIYFIPFLLTGPVVFLKTYSFSWNFAFTAE